MKQKWVDFKAIKQSVPLVAVLARYNVKLKASGKELRGRCPIHRGDGDDAFHASAEKNAFHCFSCGAKGNVLDFVAAMEECSVRDAALKLAEWFSIRAPAAAPTAPGTARSAASVTEAQGEEPEAEEENKPLGFSLRGVIHDHPYLQSRGIDPETAEYFGVGYYSGKGSMHGRIVIPIENERGVLVAYAGRAIDETEPKYKLPAGFRKGQVLYNLPRALEEDSTGAVVLVEGFFDCMKVVQAEHVCVALMGCSMSDAQEALLAHHFRQLVIMLDGDDAGRKAAREISSRLASKLWVRILDLPDGGQPDRFSPQEVRKLLATV